MIAAAPATPTTWWRPASVRVRLTLWYLGAVAAIVLLYALAVFAFLRGSLVRGLDHQLHEDFESIEDRPLLPTPDGGVNWVMARHADDDHDDERIVEIWNADATSVLLRRPERKDPSRQLPPVSTAAPNERDYTYTTVTLADGTRVRALTGRFESGRVPRVLRVARSEEPMRRELWQLAAILTLAFPAAVGVAGFGGYVLARRALAPVDRIAERARAITAERLDERIPVENPGDELGRLALVLNDTLTRLDEAFARLKRFTADASHELRTPLTAMRSVGEVGLQERRDEAAYRAVIGSMLEEVDRLTRLVDALLTLSRADAGRAQVAREPVDVGALTREVATHLEVLAEEKQQTLQVAAESALTVDADRWLLRSALINVIDNAIKYSPERAPIAVTVARDGRSSVIAVADRGPGIPAAHHARIFDRFYRVDESRSRDHGGIGLGLAIARWAVEANGGRIDVESREGGGSTFRIVLPLVLAILMLIGGALGIAPVTTAFAQNVPPRLAVGGMPDGVAIDGSLDEGVWSTAEIADAFKQTDPIEGATPTGRTSVRVLADARAIVIGIVCEDPAPDRIVSFSVRRDAPLESEDHVRVVLGPFLDGRSGYVFAVNPSGARYDGLIEPGGEDDNPDWDGIWEAATARLPNGWSAELRIPIQTVSFKPGLREWHFNVQRRMQRVPETARWASPARQYAITQTSRAGLLTGLPSFDVGLGLSVRPAITTGGGVPAPSADVDGEFQPSLDVTQRLGANLLASLTVNTDFAETEVDTRRTNLTRFPLFFEEKRTFFLEGADIFSFGLGLDDDSFIPFFSRRVGLVEGTEVPIIAGTKINGRIGHTNVGGIVVGTNDKDDVAPERALMAVGRVKQNIWRESWVGGIVTTGDPLGRGGSWLAGADFTYATSRFRSDKNFLVGVWGLVTDREDLGRDRTAHGFKIDYPNDLWDIAFTYNRIGRDFDPSLGFVPRRAVHMYDANIDNATRIARGPLQLLEHEFRPSLVTDLSGRWESYRVFMAPINWRFRSGDRVEINVHPTGERLIEPFEIADDVAIAPGAYHWRRYRLEAGTAEKRRLYTQVTWWFGGFYDGQLDQIEWTGAWNPTPLVTVEFTGERNVGDLPGGRFTQTLTGTRLRVNVSPDLSVSSYVQYDTDSDAIGVNTRLRWTFQPVADLFVVYNHNVRSILDRWQRESNQLLVKLQYTWRP